MLTGYYRAGNMKVNLRGYDRIDGYQFYLECDNLSQQKAIDAGIEYDNEFGELETIPSRNLWNGKTAPPLYLTINETSISISKYTEGKSTNRIHKDYFTTLGTLLMGCKRLCRQKYNIGWNEALGQMTHAQASQIYKIPGINLKDGRKAKYTAVVERRHGFIESIHVGTDRRAYELYLQEDDSFSEVMKKQTKTMHKLKLSYEGMFDFLKDSRKPSKADTRNYTLLDSLLTWDEIQERHPERNYGWLRDRKYHIVSNPEEVKRVCQKIREHDGIVSFDTETTGLCFTFEGKSGYGDQLVGMVFSIEEGESWYFPVRHKAIENICTEENEQEFIQENFKDILENKKILCHNGIFDMKVMFGYDIRLNLAEDTSVILQLSYTLENKAKPYSLKGATRLYLDRDSYELEDLVATGNWSFNFAELPYEYVRLYACADTDNTLALYHYLKNERVYDKFDLYNIYYNIELPFSTVVAYSEYFGMMVDMDNADKLDKDLQETRDREAEKVTKIAGYEVNLNSGDALGEFLFDKLKCPVQGYTDSGKYSTNKDTLKALDNMTDEDGNQRFPAVSHIRKYKDAQRLISSFTDPIMGRSNKSPEKRDNISPSGVISSSVQPFLETSRVSVNKPNYQSFNDTVKRYIIPRAGYYMIDADYSAVEARIIASMSGQENLIEAFFDPNTDYHKLKASLMFQMPYEDVTPQLRRTAKSFNFGIPYGMGIPSLSEYIYGDRSPEHVAQSAHLYELYFQGQDKVREFFNDGRAEGWVLGRSRTYFGGYRYYDKTKKTRPKIERESGNHKIQGTAANIYKMAMNRLYKKILKNGWWGKVLITGFIHDECLLEASCDINPAIVMKALRDSMMLPVEGWCPLYTGMGCGANWDDAKHIEIPTQLQEKMLNEYGETGFDWWKGDPNELYKNMKQYIYDYKRDTVLEYIEDEKNKGTYLPLIENDLAHEVIEAVHEGKYTNGVVDKTPAISHDVLENLENFCKMFGKEEEFKKAGLIYKPVTEGGTDGADTGVDWSVISPEDFDSMDEEKKEKYLKEAVEAYGVYYDSANDRVLLWIDNPIFLKIAKQDLVTDEGTDVWLMSEKFSKPKKTKHYKIGADDYTALQQAYISMITNK